MANPWRWVIPAILAVVNVVNTAIQTAMHGRGIIAQAAQVVTNAINNWAAGGNNQEGNAQTSGEANQGASETEQTANNQQPPPVEPLPPDVEETQDYISEEAEGGFIDADIEDLGDSLPSSMTAFIDFVSANGVDEFSNESVYQQTLRLLRYAGGHTIQEQLGVFTPEVIIRWAQENLPPQYQSSAQQQQTGDYLDTVPEAIDATRNWLVDQIIEYRLLPDQLPSGVESLPEFNRNQMVFYRNYFNQMSLAELANYYQQGMQGLLEGDRVTGVVTEYEALTGWQFYDESNFSRANNQLHLDSVTLENDVYAYGQVEFQNPVYQNDESLFNQDLDYTTGVVNDVIQVTGLQTTLNSPSPYRNFDAFMQAYNLINEQDARGFLYDQLALLNGGEVDPRWNNISTGTLLYQWRQELQAIVPEQYNMPGRQDFNSGDVPGMPGVDMQFAVSNLQILEGTYIPPDTTLLVMALRFFSGPADTFLAAVEGDWLGVFLSLFPEGLALFDRIPALQRLADNFKTLFTADNSVGAVADDIGDGFILRVEDDAVPVVEIASTTLEEAPNTTYIGVEIVDINNKSVGEFDVVNLEEGFFVERKSGRGIGTIHPRTGVPMGTPETWAQEQIYDKTFVRINNLEASAVRTRTTVGGSPQVPELAEIYDIRDYRFAVEADSPEIRAAVQEQIARLQVEFPDWTFSATFGVP